MREGIKTRLDNYFKHNKGNSLYLGNGKLTDKDCDEIVDYILNQHNSCHFIANADSVIDFTNNNIGNAGVAAVTKLIEKKIFQIVNFTNNNIESEGAQILADVYYQHYNGKIYFQLNNNNIGDQGLFAFHKLLTKDDVFLYLHLRSNNIGNEGLNKLAECASKKCLVSELDLMGNNISDEGAKSLFKLLTTCQSSNHLHGFKSLQLNDNKIGNAGLEALMQLFNYNNDLQFLLLRNNQISDQGVEKLVASYLNCKIHNLIAIDLSYNRIGNDGSRELAKILQYKKLCALHLENNKIGDDGALAFIKTTPDYSILSARFCKMNVIFRNNYISENAQKELLSNNDIDCHFTIGQQYSDPRTVVQESMNIQEDYIQSEDIKTQKIVREEKKPKNPELQRSWISMDSEINSDSSTHDATGVGIAGNVEEQVESQGGNSWLTNLTFGYFS